MDEKDRKKISKFLSLVLRHQPQTIGISLDSAGWVLISDLQAGLKRKNHELSREQLGQIVKTNDKKRFEISSDGLRIRAAQGHSVHVDLEYQPVPPPPILLHGTVEKFLKSIQTHGLVKGNRQHVHLHEDRKVAMQVGSRRGRPVILKVDASAMFADGYQFYCSTNTVWLTDRVPAQFISFPENS